MGVSNKMEVKRSEDIHEDPWAFLEKELETFQQVLRELESGAESDSTITDSPSLATSDDLSEDIEPIITKPTNIKPKPPPKPKVILTAEGKIQRIKDEETSKT